MLHSARKQTQILIKKKNILFVWIKKSKTQDFPGNPVVKTHASIAGNMGSIPGWGMKNLHATWDGQKIKETKVRSSNFTSVRVAIILKTKQQQIENNKCWQE